MASSMLCSGAGYATAMPRSPLPQHVLCQRPDDRSRTRVRLPRALGIATQKHRRIMPAAGGDDVHWHASIKQQRLVRTAQIMEAQIGKAEFAHRLGEELRQAVRVAELRE